MDEFWLEDSPQGSFEAFTDFMRGEPGPYFTPRVDANGNLIWTNNGDLPNPETVNIKGPEGNTGNNGQDGKSAYQQAVEGGYRGSEGSFNDYMANFPSMASAAQTAASQASTAAGQAAASAAHASELVDTLPDDYEDLLQDTAKTIQAVESTTVGPVPIANFDASVAGMPLNGLTVDIEPVQAGSGDPSPENVRPISGWTGANVSRTGKNYIDGTKWNVPNSTMAYVGITNSSESISAPAGEYTFSFTFKNNVRYRVYFIYSGSAWDTRRTIVSETGTSEQATLTVDGRPFKIWFYFTSGSISTDNIANVQLESGANRTEFEPYFGTTYSITFPTEAGTVYGGTVDAVNGKLKAAPYYASYNGEALVGPWISSMDVYAQGATPTLGAQVVDMGGAVTSYDLSDVPEITTLFGENTIWADCGDVTVTYGAYLETVKAHADQLGESILGTIAPLETTYTASRAYATGSFLFVGTKFYKVTAAIAEGGTITPDTNVTQTTVAEQLIALANA